jgi:putative glutamine amidotransferase
MKKINQLCALLLFLNSVLAAVEIEPNIPPGVPVIAMCQPTVQQIQNIETLAEQNLITLKKFILLGIYHEDEETDYQPSRKYVKSNGLDAVQFRIIRGKVPASELFKENLWTSQFREIFAATDAIIFTGGEDLPSALYGQETSLLTDPATPNRSLYEVSFLFHLLGGSQNPTWLPLLAERANYPLLAICLGAQSLNVAAGGSLLQDIPSDTYQLKTYEAVLKQEADRIHSSIYRRMLNPNDAAIPPAFHRIRLKPDSFFVKRLGMASGDTPTVLSAHHQAAGRLGANLWISATSMDGKIVEALEHNRFPNVLGVQFHPEPSNLYQPGLFFRFNAVGNSVFNQNDFLESHPPAMKFHRAIWKWFSDAVLAQAGQ